MSGGFALSISSSSSACSSAESTSFRVDTWCCASTTRQGEPRSGRISESPAHRVQILDDIDESLDSSYTLSGNSADMIVRGAQPLPRFPIVTANERIERAIKPQEKKRELAFLPFGIERRPLFNLDTDASLVPMTSASCLLRRPRRDAALSVALVSTGPGATLGALRGAMLAFMQMQNIQIFFQLQDGGCAVATGMKQGKLCRERRTGPPPA
jgi:hypothetical protein